MKHTNNTENLHYHIAISFLKEISKQTLSNNLKSYFDIAKDKLCIQKWDSDIKAIAYMYHEEEKSELILTTFTVEDQEQFKLKNEAVKQRKEKAATNKKEITRWEMVLEIRKMSEITEVDLTNWRYDGFIQIDKSFVIQNMIKVLEKHKKLAHITEMERLFMTVIRFDGCEEISKKLISRLEI